MQKKQYNSYNCYNCYKSLVPISRNNYDTQEYSF